MTVVNITFLQYLHNLKQNLSRGVKIASHDPFVDPINVDDISLAHTNVNLRHWHR